MARARRGAGARARGSSRPRGGAGPTPSCSTPRAPARRRCRRGASRRASAVAIALPPGARLRAGAARMPAARRRRGARRPAARRRGAASGSRRGAAVLVDEPLPLDGAAPAGGRPPRARRRRARRPHLRDDRRAAAGRADLRRTCCGARSAPASRSAPPANERWLCTLPLSHVGGLSILIRSAIYGTTAVVHERFETDRALHALRDGGVTIVEPRARPRSRGCSTPGCARPPALRCALTGGGPVPPALRERALEAGVPVSLTYGLTESCSQATTLPAAALADPAHTAGPPLFCTRLRIAGDGEIMLAGRPSPARRALQEGWLATGDLGRLDERGWLQVVGRKADTIVSGGENVAPAEVEAVLEAYPQVIEAGGGRAARTRNGGRWSRAWIVTAPGDARRLGRAARALPRTPRALQGAEGLPRIARARCREPPRASCCAGSWRERERRGRGAPRREPRELGSRRLRMGAPRPVRAGVARARLALDGRRARTRSRASACSSSPPGWARPVCWQPSSWRRAAAC